MIKRASLCSSSVCFFLVLGALKYKVSHQTKMIFGTDSLLKGMPLIVLAALPKTTQHIAMVAQKTTMPGNAMVGQQTTKCISPKWHGRRQQRLLPK